MLYNNWLSKFSSSKTKLPQVGFDPPISRFKVACKPETLMTLIDLYPTDSGDYWIKFNCGLHSSAAEKVFNYCTTSKTSNLRKP